jgi:sucrose-6F-phosphate phosphohydrolase
VTPFLLATDLDNTLVGDDEALEILNQKLIQHRQQYGSKIVYVTGRTLSICRQLAKVKHLVLPDALIVSLGTEIYFSFQDSSPSLEWSKILAQDWERKQIVAIAEKYSELQMQPESEQNPFKVSYYLAQWEVKRILPLLKADLSEQGFEVNLVYLAGQDLEILPKNADLGLAVGFLSQKWQISPEFTIACGDCLQDKTLLAGATKGVIVGNADLELRQWYQENHHDSLYLAQAVCAGGILEGLEHFGFLS